MDNVTLLLCWYNHEGHSPFLLFLQKQREQTNKQGYVECKNITCFEVIFLFKPPPKKRKHFSLATCQCSTHAGDLNTLIVV